MSTPQKAFGRNYSLWDTVKSFHWGMKFFGYACFTIDNGKFKTKSTDILIFLFTVSVTTYLIYLNVQLDLLLISTNSRVINIGSRFVLLFQITNVLASLISMFIRRRQVYGIFARCFKFDEEMTSLKMAVDHRKQFFRFIFITFAIAAVFVVMNVVTNYILYLTSDPSISVYIILSYFVINASMSTSLIAIAFILVALFNRFELINKAMREFFVTEEEDDPMDKVKSSEVSCKIVAKLADLHDSLVDIVNVFNRCFSFQLMNDVGVMFLTNIFR